MPSPSEQHGSDPAPLNRAARRARGKRKGGASTTQPGVPKHGPGMRGDQVLAQPRLKGRRGNR